MKFDISDRSMVKLHDALKPYLVETQYLKQIVQAEQLSTLVWKFFN